MLLTLLASMLCYAVDAILCTILILYFIYLITVFMHNAVFNVCFNDGNMEHSTWLNVRSNVKVTVT
jgi:hypothetical protein